MEIRIIATSNNILTNEVTLIKDGVGYLFDNVKLSYLEDGIEDVRNEIKNNRLLELIAGDYYKIVKYSEAISH